MTKYVSLRAPMPLTAIEGKFARYATRRSHGRSTIHDFFGLSSSRPTPSSPSPRLDLTSRKAASHELHQPILNGGPAVYPVLSTHHSGVSSWIKQSFEDRRGRVKEMVLNANSKINFRADVWTADEGNKRAYLAINAYFFD